ncbi:MULTISPECIES: hypothetical protein [unclassified Bradyrhizobium]|uniref:hypothetical protein n=1 Tax=unclassified Bradyrhizobium TaxID=2631580 RepID=UPI0029162EB0|nr:MULTISPECIES: hypothetical protein [unclassified Bradyrhizobium]
MAGQDYAVSLAILSNLQFGVICIGVGKVHAWMVWLGFCQEARGVCPSRSRGGELHKVGTVMIIGSETDDRASIMRRPDL